MTAKIITVFNQKGGCAKTMTTMQIAGTMGLSGLKVLAIDMDPQNTSKLWHLQATPDQPFPAHVESLAALKERFLDKLEPLTTRYDVILIDCPPALGSRVPWVSLAVSDLAIIPVIPVMDNVWASKQAEEMVLEAQEARATTDGDAGLKAVYLLSMVRRGRIFESCLEALRGEAKLPILKSQISMRNAYPESQPYGCVVSSFGNTPAAVEMDAVTLEVAKLLGIKLPKGQK